jgi:hypothetical protein
LFFTLALSEDSIDNFSSKWNKLVPRFYGKNLGFDSTTSRFYFTDDEINDSLFYLKSLGDDEYAFSHKSGGYLTVSSNGETFSVQTTTSIGDDQTFTFSQVSYDILSEIYDDDDSDYVLCILNPKWNSYIGLYPDGSAFMNHRCYEF